MQARELTTRDKILNVITALVLLVVAMLSVYGFSLMHSGKELVAWALMTSCVWFIIWYHNATIVHLERLHNPDMDECPRCGRTLYVDALDRHLVRCSGKPIPRNPLSAGLQFITASFNSGENTDEIPLIRGKPLKSSKGDDPNDLEDLY